MSKKSRAPALVRPSVLRTSIQVEELTPSIGAQLLNVNLGDAARDADLVEGISALLLKHRVLFLRDQDFSPADQALFASCFGELEGHPMVPSHPEAPGLVQIYKNPDTPMDRFENAWHSDGSWRDCPAMGCVLRCVECPETGGDTLWANMVLAYANLPEQVKQEIAGLIASHSFQASFGAAQPAGKRAAFKAQYPDAEHPVVRTHPETEEKILYVDAFTTHFVNYHSPRRVRFGQDNNQAGADLLQYLISQAYIPEYQVRWHWRRNSVAIWDNHSTQHYAVMDYPPCIRKMDRAGIAGGRPY
jgi:taurine dioxygenase